MCGIAGFLSLGNNASIDVYKALLLLQHRGQDAAGIVSFDGKNFYSHKGKGYVDEVFLQKIVAELKGFVAIGQTRYPTVGGGKAEDAQPFLRENKKTGKIALCHNGNIANYHNLVQTHKTSSGCDAELILEIFSSKLSPPTEENIFKAVEETMSELNGAYSVICVLENGMLAFRDRFGIRPLVLGLKETPFGKEFAFSSETQCFDMLDFSYSRDVRPGEAIFISFNKREILSKQIVPAEPKPCMFEYTYFSRPDNYFEKKLVYSVRRNLGKFLALQWLRLKKDADIVTPVPTTSIVAAQAFAELTDMPYREVFVKNRYVGRTFIMPGQTKREDAVKLKLMPIKEEIEGKKIVLIDDSLVRGTTAKKIISMLRKQGASRVYFLLTTPPIRYPCFYGIDMQTRAELMASYKTEEEIAGEIGADEVIYMTLENLKKSIGRDEICDACLTGKYPTKISQTLFESIEKKRQEEKKKISEETISKK